MEIALHQAKDGRLHILKQMAKALTVSREGVSEHAPRMHTLKINREKIRDLIGPGGKVIREITERCQVKIDIDEDGNVTVAAMSQDKMDEAIASINGITAEPEVGKIYKASVVKIVDFGAFVKFMGEREGLVHVSEISGERIEKVADVLKQGQVVMVKVVGFDDRGKIRLTMKGIPQDEAA
jgi:polyribonucleotide nucleotidyltransferase